MANNSNPKYLKNPDSYYARNRGKEITRAKINNCKQVEKMLLVVFKLKLKPCLDCGERFEPWLMEFDHRLGSEKKDSICKLVNDGASENIILKEIAKCDLICVLCHRRRTFKRGVEAGSFNKYTPEIFKLIADWLKEISDIDNRT